MLVVLDVERRKNKSIGDKLYSLMKPCSIEKKIVKNNDISIFEIDYILNRGDINFKKLQKIMAGMPKEILCDESISLKNTPFTRFHSNALNRQMMKNFLSSLLSTDELSSQNLRISFYDPNGEYPSVAQELVKYTSCLTVVSNMPKFYENESDRLLSEMGASFVVSNSVERLSPCDILVCPEKIKIPLPTMCSSLIFTVQKPLVQVTGTVIYEYVPDFPIKYREIKPECIDDFYFLSALYSLCEKKNLGKLVPSYCCAYGKILTTEQISKRINAQLMFELV